MGGRWLRRVSVAVVLVGAALPASALAAFPGQNGKIAFETSRDGGDADIYAMNADGNAETPLTSNTAHDISPAWSPDGTKIAFASNREGDYGIYVMNADGSGQTSLDSPGSDPAWSPDGTKIAFARGGDIHVMNADGTNQLDVIFGPSLDGLPAWSPDGSRLAFERYVGGGGPPWLQIYVANADGSAQRSVTPQNPDDLNFAGDNIDPTWSPNGLQLAFAHDTCEGSCDPKPSFTVYFVSPDDPNPQYTSTGGGRAPAWSPDGRLIAFNRCYFTPFAECDGTDVGTLSLTGGPQMTLTDDRGSGSPDWQTIPYPGYARPKGATPMRVSLVPAYRECASANRTHGPPLAFGSCSAPAQESGELTVGDAPANMSGFVRYETMLGNPSTPADEADIALRVQISDVREQGTPADYAGEVEARANVRLTDRNGNGTDPATATNVLFPLTTQCSPTAAVDIGATCSLTTTLDTLIPGAIAEGQRTVLQLSQVQVVDGGPDGDAATEPNTVFLRQGIFVP